MVCLCYYLQRVYLLATNFTTLFTDSVLLLLFYQLSNGAVSSDGEFVAVALLRTEKDGDWYIYP